MWKGTILFGVNISISLSMALGFVTGTDWATWELLGAWNGPICVRILANVHVHINKCGRNLRVQYQGLNASNSFGREMGAGTIMGIVKPFIQIDLSRFFVYSEINFISSHFSDTLISRIEKMLKYFQQAKILHYLREENACADWLVNWIF